MKETTCSAALDGIREETVSLIETAESYMRLSFEDLNWKADADSWSIAQVFVHLNCSGKYLLKQFNEVLVSADTKCSCPSEHIKNSFFGRQIEKSLHGDSHFKTSHNFCPSKESYTTAVLDEFVEMQTLFLQQMDIACQINVNCKKVKPFMLDKFFKLRLGEAMRLKLLHEQRHMKQIENLIDQANFKSASA